MFGRYITNKISQQSRTKKLNQFLTIIKPTSTDTILEVGVENTEYAPVSNFLVKNYPYPHNITALGIGDLSKFRKTYPNVSIVNYDGRTFPFRKNQFDIAHSNAVIEHVGPFEAQEMFLKEIVRVSKRGMITMPNKYFPIEIHTRVPLLHWTEKKKFDRFLRWIGKDWATDGYMHLLGENELRLLIKSVDLVNYRIIKNRFFGFVMTFSLIWFNEILLDDKQRCSGDMAKPENTGNVGHKK